MPALAQDNHWNWFERGLAHGAAQGSITEATGGEFRHGFYAGFAVGASEQSIGKWTGDSTVRGVTAAALVGGTSSALGGGKFANGAASGAFVYLFNRTAHKDPIPSNQISARVDLAFYDARDPGGLTADYMHQSAGHESFEAGAVAHSPTRIPVRSEADIANYFRNNPGIVNSIGWFGHGNEDGIVVNGSLISNSTIKLFGSHLASTGQLYLFSCDVSNLSAALNYAKYLNVGQSLYAHRGEAQYVRLLTPTGPVPTGEIHSPGESDILWMYKYTRTK